MELHFPPFQTLKYLFQWVLQGTLLSWETVLPLILCPRRENSKWPKNRTLCSWEELVFQQKLLLFIPWHKNAYNREREAGSQSWQARPRGLSWEFQLTALAPQFLVNVCKLDLVVLPFHPYLVFYLNASFEKTFRNSTPALNRNGSWLPQVGVPSHFHWIFQHLI